MTYDKQLLQEAEQAGLKFEAVVLSPQNEMVFIKTINGVRVESALKNIPFLIEKELDKAEIEMLSLNERLNKGTLDYNNNSPQDPSEHRKVILDIQIQFAMLQKRIAALKNFYATVENLLLAWNTQRIVIENESDPQHDPSSHSAQNERSIEESKKNDTAVPFALYQNSQAELNTAFSLIKRLKKRINFIKRPPKEFFEHLVDETRKKNGKINYSALSQKTGQTDKTIKRWCHEYGIK